MGVSQKTIQNLIRIGEAIKSGLYPPGMDENYKKEQEE